MKRNEEDEKRKKNSKTVRKSRNQSNFREVGLVWLRSIGEIYPQRRIIERSESGCGVDSRATCACVPCEIAISSSDIITWSLLWLVDVSVCEACISIFWVIVFSVILRPLSVLVFFLLSISTKWGYRVEEGSSSTYICIVYSRGGWSGVSGVTISLPPSLAPFLFVSFSPSLFSISPRLSIKSASRTRPYLLYYIVCIYRI